MAPPVWLAGTAPLYFALVLSTALAACDHPLGYGPGCEEDVWATSGGKAVPANDQPLQQLGAASRLARFLSDGPAAEAHAADNAFLNKDRSQGPDDSGAEGAAPEHGGHVNNGIGGGALLRGLVTAVCLLVATRYCTETLRTKRVVDGYGDGGAGGGPLPAVGPSLAPHLAAREAELEVEAASLQAAAAPLTHCDPRAGLTPDQERVVQSVLFAQQAALRDEHGALDLLDNALASADTQGLLHLSDIIEALGVQYQLLQAKGSRLQGDMQRAQLQLQLLADGDAGAGARVEAGGTAPPPYLPLADAPLATVCPQFGSGSTTTQNPVSYECPDPDRVPPYTVHPVATSSLRPGTTAMVVGAARPSTAHQSPQPSPLRGHIVSGSISGRRSSGGTDALVLTMETHHGESMQFKLWMAQCKEESKDNRLKLEFAMRRRQNIERDRARAEAARATADTLARSQRQIAAERLAEKRARLEADKAQAAAERDAEAKAQRQQRRRRDSFDALQRQLWLGAMTAVAVLLFVFAEDVRDRVSGDWCASGAQGDQSSMGWVPSWLVASTSPLAHLLSSLRETACWAGQLALVGCTCAALALVAVSISPRLAAVATGFICVFTVRDKVSLALGQQPAWPLAATAAALFVHGGGYALTRTLGDPDVALAGVVDRLQGIQLAWFAVNVGATALCLAQLLC